MNYSEMVKKVAEECGLTDKKAKEVLECVVNTVQDGLRREEEVALRGLGKLSVKRTAARKQKIGSKEWDIPAGVKIKFKPSESFREELTKQFYNQ